MAEVLKHFKLNILEKQNFWQGQEVKCNANNWCVWFYQPKDVLLVLQINWPLKIIIDFHVLITSSP